LMQRSASKTATLTITTSTVLPKADAYPTAATVEQLL